ncbi:MAG: hypothetical protein CVU06_04630 [Bacteroidetes bacterium HGW-Bacteroidetes-22]|nr:MAG: hypothetical protein CVU06_04630 [Bacteroidetes bacterium HGW-Bacteroidetes-22]
MQLLQFVVHLRFNKHIMKNTLFQCAVMLFLMINLSLSAQISGTINGLAGEKVILASYRGDQLRIVDTIVADNNGNIDFKPKKQIHNGLYRIIYKQGNGFDVLADQEPVKFTADTGNTTVRYTDTINSDYQRLMKTEALYQRKVDLLTQLIDGYPSGEPFYKKATAQYVKEQIDYSAFLNGMIRRHHGTLLSLIAMNLKRPFLAPELNPDDRKKALRENFWQAGDATDTSLILTNVYTRKTIEFLTFYSNPEFTKEELQASFITGINALLPHINQQPKVFAFIMEYLINGFEQFGFEEVLRYLATMYESEGCTDEASRTRLAGKVEIIRRMAPGNVAPPLMANRPDGSAFTLNDIRKPYNIIIFWASWCPHCNEILPQIDQLYREQAGEKWDVLAYSLDTNKSEWEKAIQKSKYLWTNVSELKGWNSPSSEEWGIFATPTLFILGPGLKIIAKPYNFTELTDSLRELGLISR